ncbi:hypothetical protein [Planctomicrobium piriforme]|uniref:Uncharacterized protein n=1 Tax=Planctomicrobium piriforme TaxID=1576369 RepID=A0A1I3F4Q9_9PLAN|nr:hypothetical protein [Planctomicrobium piriforme]SFI05781.1 hypothetical protein SAMN05421753_10569 [Planctomicrobium piriforme]
MQSWFESFHPGWLAVLVIGIGVIVFIARLVGRQREDAWKRAARHLKLKYHIAPEGPVVSGQLDERKVDLRIATDSSDSGGGVVVARVKVDVPGVPNGMSAEAAPGVIGDLTNVADGHVLTGDNEFDRGVHLLGADENSLRAYWTPPRRRAFLTLVQAQNDDRLALASGALVAERRGILKEHRAIEDWLRQLVATANELASSLN